MPRGDGTGPLGQGSKTGRGLGPCNRNTVTQSDDQDGFFSKFGNMFKNRNIGRGAGRGQGQGRGQGRGMNRMNNN